MESNTLYSNETLYVAFDVESFGISTDAHVVSVGVCYGKSLTDYKKQRWTCSPDNVTKDQSIDEWKKHIEEVCYNSFWSKNLPLLQAFRNESCMNSSEMWQSITEFLDQVVYSNPQQKVIILTDNAGFDISLMNFNLWKYTKRVGVRYNQKGKYHSIDDPCEQLTYHPQKQQIYDQVYSKCQHSHYPDDDAEVIYYTFLLTKHQNNVNLN